MKSNLRIAVYRASMIGGTSVIRYTRKIPEEEIIASQGKYRGFLLDADNTLFDFDRCETEAVYETLSALLRPMPEMIDEYRKINITLWEQLENNETSAADLKVERFRLLLRRLGVKADPEELSIRYLEHLSHKHYLMPHAISLLEFLSKRSLICLVTNGLAYVQKNRIARAELEVFFNDILISEEIGMVKPDPEFFRLGARRLRLSPHDVLCVGDNPLADIKGAHEAGIDTCWYSPCLQSYPAGCPPPDYAISDLMEVKKFVVEVS